MNLLFDPSTSSYVSNSQNLTDSTRQPLVGPPVRKGTHTAEGTRIAHLRLLVLREFGSSGWSVQNGWLQKKRFAVGRRTNATVRQTQSKPLIDSL